MFAGAIILAGCGSPSEQKATQAEVESFKGKPLTPEQVQKLRGNMGGGGPMSSGPKTGGNTGQPSGPTNNR